MAGQSRKWMILIATIWIQAFTGTNFDFSSYSSTMKSVLKISQVQLNYLATASVSICWFNTVCFVLCIKNFPVNRPLALSLTVGFHGVSAALYTLAANSINPLSDQLYLLLNALVPLLTLFAALLLILRQPP
ncbi:hypothetical protein RYX36_016724 [Vicia faba]